MYGVKFEVSLSLGKLPQVLVAEHERLPAAVELHRIAARGHVERLHGAFGAAQLELFLGPMQLNEGTEERVVGSRFDPRKRL